MTISNEIPYLPLLITGASLIISTICAYRIAKYRLKAGMGTQISTAKFLNQIESIQKFIESDGAQKGIQLLTSLKIDDFKRFLDVNQDIEEHLRTYSDKLETISRLINKQIFNEVNGRIHHYIEDNSKFIERLDEEKGSKIYLADNFIKVPIVTRILNNRETIFIESGSTFSYLILPIIDYIKRQQNSNGNYGKPIVICTNNVIIYIILLFEKNIATYLLPGKPTNQYAATFGDSTNTEAFSAQETRKFFDRHHITSIFSTASFLDIEYGPHVSSYPNWEMKRFLNQYTMEKGLKNIFVITSEKINNSVSDNKLRQDCKLIFSDISNDPTACPPPSLKDLEAAKKEFIKHLNNDKNYIITASREKKICLHQINKMMNIHNRYVDLWSFELESGALSVLSNKPLM